MDEMVFPFAASFAGAESVAVSYGGKSVAYDDCSIFPPELHEGLHFHPDPDQTLASPAPILDEAGSGTLGSCFPARDNGETEFGLNRYSGLAKTMVGSWFEFVRSKLVVGCGGSAEAVVGILSCATLAGMAGVFFYMRRRHRREKEFLLFLIQENNQKVELLLHQIAELNAVLAAHRKVPVLRKA